MKWKYEKEEMRGENSESESRILGEKILIVSTGNFDVFYVFYGVEFMANRKYVHSGSY